MLRDIKWLRILIAGVAVELALMLLVPLNFLPNGTAILQLLVIPACLIATFAAGWWAARRAVRLHWLHGLLAGLVAMLIYMALTWGQELPLTYHLGGWAKLAGGAAGGWLAGRRAMRVA